MISDTSTIFFAMPEEFTLDNLPKPREKKVSHPWNPAAKGHRFGNRAKIYV
ncbi:MAG: hypothetical protein LLF84_08785 [Methanoregulaceae archaeon]|nr:hypothetical protein [Methanoregulaceae archaeon]